MLKIYAVAAVAAVAALVGGTGWYVYQKRSGDPYAGCRQSVIAGGAGAVGGPFSLLDQTGKRVSEKEVLDGAALVYFGYTFCPDVCPMDMARNVEAVDVLEERGFSVKPVFVTVDPKRDTPEVLAEYAEALHPNLTALTGTPEQIDAAAKAYRVYYKAQDSQDPDYYLVDHMTFTYLMHPTQGFLEFFKRELTPDQLADQVSCFLDKG